MSGVQELEQKQLRYSLYLYLYLAVLMEVMQPAAEPNLKEDAGNALQVLAPVQVKVQMEAQVEVQQMPVLYTPPPTPADSGRLHGVRQTPTDSSMCHIK